MVERAAGFYRIGMTGRCNKFALPASLDPQIGHLLDDDFGFHLAEIGSPLMVSSAVAASNSAVQM